MRALVVEHDPLSTPERVGDYLELRGVSLEPFVVVPDISDPEVTAEFPVDEPYDMVVVMGAPWSVYDRRVQGWVVPELAFIREHLRRDTPILGICFGAQLLATAMGAVVSPSDRPEYGWGYIESTAPGMATGPWFQFHQDEFSLPRTATARAHNESGLQAFTSRRALAVQFHPEVTSRLVASWFAAGGDAKVIAAGIDPDELVEETSRLATESQPALERMLDWWLDDLSG